MNNKLLDNLEKDIKLCKEENYHPKCHNLLEMLICEDIPELIKFARKVNAALETKPPYPNSTYQMGYNDCDMDLRKQIYGE